MRLFKSCVMKGVAVALLLGGAASKSLADEPGTFSNHLWEEGIGIPAGAAPPPGVYTGIEFLFAPQVPGQQNNGNQSNNRISGTVAGVPLVWSTGWNIFGASYVVAVAQGFLAIGAGTSTEGVGTYLSAYANTAFSPIFLSWNLGNGLFVSTGFTFVVPDGSKFTNTVQPIPDYWTFEPSLAISYLSKDWVLSANMYYDFNTASKGLCCAGTAAPAFLGKAPFNGWVSGQTFSLDATALRRFGNWTLGPVGYMQAQTTDDQPGGGVSCATLAATTPFACGHVLRVGLGGLVGYDFGPVQLQTWVTDGFIARDCAACVNTVEFWSRLNFKVWGPDAPHPMVAKN